MRQVVIPRVVVDTDRDFGILIQRDSNRVQCWTCSDLPTRCHHLNCARHLGKEFDLRTPERQHVREGMSAARLDVWFRKNVTVDRHRLIIFCKSRFLIPPQGSNKVCPYQLVSLSNHCNIRISKQVTR